MLSVKMELRNCRTDKIMRGKSKTVSYDKLWVILKEREMLKTDLIKAAKISTNAMAKLGKNEDVRIGVLVKICETLKCKLDDIVEIG